MVSSPNRNNPIYISKWLKRGKFYLIYFLNECKYTVCLMQNKNCFKKEIIHEENKIVKYFLTYNFHGSFKYLNAQRRKLLRFAWNCYQGFLAFKKKLENFAWIVFLQWFQRFKNFTFFLIYNSVHLFFIKLFWKFLRWQLCNSNQLKCLWNLHLFKRYS